MKEIGKISKAVHRNIAKASSEEKNAILQNMASSIENRAEEILNANLEDINEAKDNGLNPVLIDRLSVQGNRLKSIVNDIQEVIRLPDPIGETFESQTLQNNLALVKQRTPLGVLGVIYESRPNVTVDVSALAIKSGNCAILRGGKESLQTNQAFVMAIQKGLEKSGFPKEIIQLVKGQERELVKAMLKAHDYIDLIIPRGSHALQEFCREHSTIPVITGGIGICHLFVERSANLVSSLEVILNAKTQRPTVCNALDTLLVEQAIAPSFIPKVIALLREKGVGFRLDPLAWEIMSSYDYQECKTAGGSDWDTEWLSLVLGIKVVANIEEAIEHIHEHSSKHSDGILTENQTIAERFVKEVDSAAVYVNASTRFTDGGQLGLGAEVAISTQKLHARGPMGLKELTSYKWIIRGNYHTRN